MQLEQVLANFKRFEGLVGEADLLTRREENQNLLLLMRLEEAEEGIEFVLNGQLHVVVEERGRCDRLQTSILIVSISIIFVGVAANAPLNSIEVMNRDVLSIAVELDACQIPERLCDSG